MHAGKCIAGVAGNTSFCCPAASDYPSTWLTFGFTRRCRRRLYLERTRNLVYRCVRSAGWTAKSSISQTVMRLAAGAAAIALSTAGPRRPYSTHCAAASDVLRHSSCSLIAHNHSHAYFLYSVSARRTQNQLNATDREKERERHVRLTRLVAMWVNISSSASLSFSFSLLSVCYQSVVHCTTSSNHRWTSPALNSPIYTTSAAGPGKIFPVRCWLICSSSQFCSYKTQFTTACGLFVERWWRSCVLSVILNPPL